MGRVVWAGFVVAGALFSAPAPARAQQGGRSLGLETLARSALDSNRDLIAAREGLTVAREQVTEAWSNVYPSVDLNASYSRNISPSVQFLPEKVFNPAAGDDDYIGVQFGADNNWSSTISLEQPLVRAGVFVGIGAASRFESLQVESVRGQAQSVVTQVRLSYYQVLLAQEQVRLTENSLLRVRESLKETTALNAAGLASDYDVLRLQVEVANLEPNLRRAENTVLQARRQLAAQVDFAEPESLAVTGTLAEIDLENPDANSAANREILGFMGYRGTGVESVDEALRLAVDQRSDVRQSTLNEDLRHAEMRVEQMQYVPEVTLFGNYVITAQNNGGPSFFATGNGVRAYSRIVGVRVSVPIFQGFRRTSRIDQKRASFRQAEVQTDQVLDLARNEVRGLVENAEEAFLRAQGQRLAVGQAQRGFEIASAQYREGLGSQLELTDSEGALRQSEFNYAQAVYDYLVARARLDQATGRVPLVDVDAAE
jgi:outer membrane protein TolC